MPEFIYVLGVPNFANYDVKNPILHPGVVIQNEASYYMKTVGYGFLYIAVLLIRTAPWSSRFTP